MNEWDEYELEPARGFIDPPGGDRRELIRAVCDAASMPDDDPVWRYQVLRELLEALRRHDAFMRGDMDELRRIAEANIRREERIDRGRQP